MQSYVPGNSSIEKTLKRDNNTKELSKKKKKIQQFKIKRKTGSCFECNSTDHQLAQCPIRAIVKMLKSPTVASNRDIHIQNELFKMNRNFCLWVLWGRSQTTWTRFRTFFTPPSPLVNSRALHDPFFLEPDPITIFCQKFQKDLNNNSPKMGYRLHSKSKAM